MLSKIAKEESRGTLFGMFSLVGSVGTLVINKLGGYLFDAESHFWPFMISLIAQVVFIVMNIIMGMLGKLNI
jgi:hypothetical protein